MIDSAPENERAYLRKIYRVDCQVHGKDAASERLMESITLPSLHGFRDFSSQAIFDVMAYLTPK